MSSEPVAGVSLAEARAAVRATMRVDNLSLTRMAARLKLSHTAELDQFLHGEPTPLMLTKVGAWLGEPIVLNAFELVRPAPPAPRLTVIAEPERLPTDPPGFTPVRKVTTGPGRAITLRIDPDDERMMLSFPARNALGRPSHVRVLIDAEGQRALIVPSLRGDPDAYQLLGNSGRIKSTVAVRTLRSWGWAMHAPLRGEVSMGGLLFTGEMAE